MKLVLLILQAVLALILTLLILVQSKGTGLSKSWGGGTLKSFTRRGLEKLIFRATFVILAIFLVISFLQLVM
jgi:protein translocase SecG subunit